MNNIEKKIAIAINAYANGWDANDAANYYADSYEEYMAIWDAIIDYEERKKNLNF